MVTLTHTKTREAHTMKNTINAFEEMIANKIQPAFSPPRAAKATPSGLTASGNGRRTES